MLIITFNKCITRKIALLNIAVKLNCLVKISLCLDGCVNCFENNYIILDTSGKSTEKSHKLNCFLLFLQLFPHLFVCSADK